MTGPKIQQKNWFHILACPVCKQHLLFQDNNFYCGNCQTNYAVQNGIPFLMNKKNLSEYEGVLLCDGREMVAQYLATSVWSKFVHAIQQFITVDYIPYPPDLKKYLQSFGRDPLGLEVGSGSRRLYPNIINLDIGPFPEVDIIADGANLPFQNGCLDYVIIDVVLEHVKYPQQFVQEAYRTLKKSGILYLSVPFVHPYHSFPVDYHRFSKDGLILLTEYFHIEEIGILRGPMVALLNCITELPYLFLFSNNQKFYQIIKGVTLFMIFWLKYLDKILVKNPQSHRLAHSLYIIGKKK
jgi:uncharacterized protein YbaR (Trm112 family)